MRRTFVMLPVSVGLSVLLAGCGGAGHSPTTAPGTQDDGVTVTATTVPAPAVPGPAELGPPAPDPPAPGPAAPGPAAPGPASAEPATTPAASCTDTGGWGTGTKQSALYSAAPIYRTRIGRHECHDRVVFDINGPEPVGYHVSYVPVVIEDGSGREIPVAGGAALQVIVHAPTQGSPGDDSGHQPGVVFAPSGEYLHGPEGLEGWGALRAVRSAGSFEGQSTFAVGVRDRLPFTVTTWVDENQTAHVIVDIAHR